MNEINNKSNLMVGALLAVVPGMVFIMFNSEITKLVTRIRNNPFEAFVLVILLILLFSLLRLHYKINEMRG